MCFGGGGGGRTPSINVIPANPIVKAPEPPEPIRDTFKPLQSKDATPGFRLAGATKRMQQGYDPQRESRRRSLSTGIAMAQNRGFGPSGGINL
jgi:hypothetical protein